MKLLFSMFWLLRCNNNYIDFQIDDQIALLINAWCELLVFSCCYRSVNSPGLIRVSNEKSLDLATAKRFGIEKCIDKMLNFTEQLRRLKVDYYEYVSMKVIVLLTSGKLSFRYSLILIKKMLNISVFHGCNWILYSFIFTQMPPDSRNQSMFETRKKKLYKHCNNIQQRNIHRFLLSLENYFSECQNCIEFVRYVNYSQGW